MEQGKLLLAEINRIRLNPQGTIFDLKEQLGRFEGPHTILTNKGERIKVNEGKYVWTEATIFLDECASRDPLIWCESLAFIAHQFENQTRNGEQRNPFQLLKDRYEYNGNISFNVSQSQAEQSMKEIVLSMIVDDGDRERANRTTVTSTKYTHFGGFVTKRGKVTIAVMFFSDTADFKLKLPGDLGTKFGTQKSSTLTVQQMLDSGRELIYELNDIRRDPKRLIPQLKADLAKFKPDGSFSKNGYSYATKQGKAAFYDLITDLEETPSLPHTLRSDGLSVAAVEQVTDLDRQTEHSSVITNKGSHVSKYTNAIENSSNFITNKEQKDAIIDMLILALVDDGDSKRSVRKKLLSPIMKFIGASVGKKFFAINIAQYCDDNKNEINTFLAVHNKDGRQKPKIDYNIGATKFDDRMTFGVGEKEREKEQEKYVAPSISVTPPPYTYSTGEATSANTYASSYYPPPVTNSSNFTSSSYTSSSYSDTNTSSSKLGSTNPYTYGSTVYEEKPHEESPRFKQPEQERGTDNKVITKKTTKSSTSSRNGRTYKKIVTKIQYEDGTISQIEEEEIVN